MAELRPIGTEFQTTSYDNIPGSELVNNPGRRVITWRVTKYVDTIHGRKEAIEEVRWVFTPGWIDWQPVFTPFGPEGEQ